MSVRRASAAAAGSMAVALIAACAMAPALAAEVGGVELAERMRVSGYVLELASCGVRDTLWIDHYAVGLYLPKGASPGAASDPDRAKAVRMKIISARYLPENIPGKWREALASELQREPMMRVRRSYRKLEDGDVVTFFYLPSSGVTMNVNGDTVIAGRDHAVIDSILSAWAERDPIGEKLHRLELKHPC